MDHGSSVGFANQADGTASGGMDVPSVFVLLKTGFHLNPDDHGKKNAKWVSCQVEMIGDEKWEVISNKCAAEEASGGHPACAGSCLCRALHRLVCPNPCGQDAHAPMG